MGHIWLIGMMGVGKTTVAAIVAERLELPLTDTDAMVMERAGRTIPQIFAEGEASFRAIESAVVAEIANGAASVVATGGGVVLDERNVAAMRRAGTTILLTADVETIMHRLGEVHDRPLYTDSETLTRVDRERAQTYAAAADHVVDTDGRTMHDVAEEVIRCTRT